MTLMDTLEDTSKALFSDGAWYILPKEEWDTWDLAEPFPHKSVIYHQCRNHWKQHWDSDVWIPTVQYRITVSELNIPCGSCGDVCPEALQGLWKLHNFDSIQSHPS